MVRSAVQAHSNMDLLLLASTLWLEVLNEAGDYQGKDLDILTEQLLIKTIAQSTVINILKLVPNSLWMTSGTIKNFSGSQSLP